MKRGLPAFQVSLGVNHDFTGFLYGGHEIMVSAAWDAADEFSYYTDNQIMRQSIGIGNYAIEDPTSAPAGKNAIGLTGILTFDYEDKWRWNQSHKTYQDFKYSIGMALVERVEADYLPGLSQYIEVMEGLEEGQEVVVSGQFLIDSESSLKAGFQRMRGADEPPM